MSEKLTLDPATACMLDVCEDEGIITTFQRAADMKPCPIGSGKSGVCCKVCNMGPCRLTKPGQVGLCGATADVIVARNMARIIAAGTAAHSDHGRDLAFTLLAVAKGETRDYQIRDVNKLMSVAQVLGVRTEGRAVLEIAGDVANRAINAFGQQRGELPYIARAPKKRQEIWRKLGLVPRGIDREVVETLHRTHAGNDQDAEHIMRSGDAHLARRWLGRLDDGHRHLRYPVWHALPPAGQVQSRRARSRRGQHRRAWSRADPLRDDPDGGQHARDDRVRQVQGRQGHQPHWHLLHRQRTADAPGHCHHRQFPAARNWR